MAKFNITYEIPSSAAGNDVLVTASADGTLNFSSLSPNGREWVTVTDATNDTVLLLAVPAHLVVCVMKTP